MAIKLQISRKTDTEKENNPDVFDTEEAETLFSFLMSSALNLLPLVREEAECDRVGQAFVSGSSISSCIPEDTPKSSTNCFP